MNIEVSEPVAPAEGTALPPPRRFAETNTITLPRGRRAAAQRGMVARVVEAAAVCEPGHARIAVVDGDSTPLTITFAA